MRFHALHRSAMRARIATASRTASPAGSSQGSGSLNSTMIPSPIR